MKKILGWIKNVGINLAANAIINQLEEAADKALEDFYIEDQEACIASVKGFYSFLPLLQRITAKTETKLDDNAVTETKKELEDFCSRHGITL